jgi:hypothetical protein
MYAVLRRYTLASGSMGQLVREIQEHFLFRLSQIAGFVSYEVVVEGDQALTTISVFDSDSGAHESTRAAADFVRELGDRFTLDRRDTIEGAVLVHQEATIGAAR